MAGRGSGLRQTKHRLSKLRNRSLDNLWTKFQPVCYIYRAYAVAQSISLVGHVGGQPHVIRKRLHMWDRNFRVSLQVE